MVTKIILIVLTLVELVLFTSCEDKRTINKSFKPILLENSFNGWQVKIVTIKGNDTLYSYWNRSVGGGSMYFYSIENLTKFNVNEK